MENSKYRAPALEKGLDILELLSRENRPLLISNMASLLERSVGEIFRMVTVLVDRGYLETSESGDALVLSNKLFLLGMSSGPNQNLVSKAIPLMQSLSKRTKVACHLVIAANEQIIVIAHVEAPGQLGYSVRVGHIAPMTLSNSGIILFAFQNEKARGQIKENLRIKISENDLTDFEAKAKIAAEKGVMIQKSNFADAVTDVSCPVFSDKGIVAALTMPYLSTKVSSDLATCVSLLEFTAETISRELGG